MISLSSPRMLVLAIAAAGVTLSGAAVGQQPAQSQQQPAPRTAPAQPQRPPAQPQQQQQQRPPAQQPAAQPQPARPPQPLPPQGTAIVVADVIAILQNSRASTQVRGQIERRRNDYQNEIQKQEADLRNADQELARQRAVLSPEAFAQKRRELEQRVSEAQNKVNDRRRILDQAFGDAMQKVQDAVIEVVTQIASDNQYQMVLPRSQVLTVHSSLDITDEVMRRVNAKLPSVPVTLPAN